MSDDIYGKVPDVDDVNAGRGTHDIGEGIVQRKTYGEDEIFDYGTRSTVPTYKPDTPEGT